MSFDWKLGQKKKQYPEKREQFRVMALAGVPYREIQAALGVAKSTVFLWQAEMKIPNRKRGRPRKER